MKNLLIAICLCTASVSAQSAKEIAQRVVSLSQQWYNADDQFDFAADGWG